MAETAFKLRSNIFSSLKVTTPSGGYTAGDMVKINNTVGVIVETTDAGDDAVLVYKAEKIIVPCVAVTSGSFQKGAKVYFDAADAEVNESSSGNTLCGIVTEDGVVGAETVEIELDGTLGIVA